jgi:broad specificity phosphatase PhoE
MSRLSFFILRHGKTAANNPKAELIRGWQPLPLADEGQKQARQAGYFLAPKMITHIWHSPLKRVQETTEIVNKTLELSEDSVFESGELLDWNTGFMQGMLVSAMKPLLDYFQRNPKLVIPGGESYREYWDRWEEAWENVCDWVRKNPDNKLLVITHARNIVTAQHWEKGREIGPVSYDNVPEPGGIVEVTLGDGDKFNMKILHGKKKADPDP